MPVGWITGVLRMIEDGDRNRMIAGRACKRAPATARPPGGRAFYAFAGEIDPGCWIRSSWSGGDLRRATVGIHEGAALLLRRLKPAGNAHAQQPFLIVFKYGAVESLDRDNLIDYSRVTAVQKNIARGLLQKRLVFSSDPRRLDDKFAAIRAALGRDDFAVNDGAHLRAIFGLDGVGVVPEIEAIHVAVVEPQSGMMRMVDAFVGTRLEWVATGDGDAFIVDERIEHRLLQRRWPDIRGKRLAVNGDIDAAMRLVGDNLNAFACRNSESGPGQRACRNQKAEDSKFKQRPCLPR